MIDVHKRKLQEAFSDFETSGTPYIYVTSPEGLIFIYYGDERIKSEEDVVEIKKKSEFLYGFGTSTLMQFFLNLKRTGNGKLMIFSYE